METKIEKQQPSHIATNAQAGPAPMQPTRRRRNRAKAQAPTSAPAASVAPLPSVEAVQKNSSSPSPVQPSIPNSSATEKLTQVQAKIDVGFGNALFIRGQGDGLSWEKGCQLTCLDASTWSWSSSQARDKVVFKLLLNDQLWAQGEDLTVQAGRKIELVPVFA